MVSSNSGMENDPRYYQYTIITAGNSGGPLFSKYGKIVVNTLTVSKRFDDDTGIDTENIFYSIKINYLKILMDNLNIDTLNNNELLNLDIPINTKNKRFFVFFIEVVK